MNRLRSDRVDHSFIGVYDVRARTVTFLSPGVDRDTSPTWSPDSKRIAFLRRPGLPFGQQAQPGSGGIGNPPGPAYVPGMPSRGQRSGQPVQPGQRGAGQRGGPERPSIPGLTTATFKGGYTLSFWVAEATTGEAREFWHNGPDEGAFTIISDVRWAGDRVIFPSEPEEWIRYYSVSVSGEPTAPVVLTPGDGMVENIGLSGDGRTLYYCTNAGDIDRRHVWKVATSGGDAVQLTKGEEIETYPVALASGTRVAVLSADARRPQSVGIAPSGGGPVKIIFPALPKEFPLADEVVPQNVTIRAEDGLEIHNQLFLPKDLRSGEKRPAVIFVHGGPVRQMLLGYHYMHFYHIAYAANQWLASQGYVVMSVNYRRGIGYGKSFRTAPGTGAAGNAGRRRRPASTCRAGRMWTRSGSASGACRTAACSPRRPSRATPTSSRLASTWPASTCTAVPSLQTTSRTSHRRSRRSTSGNRPCCSSTETMTGTWRSRRQRARSLLCATSLKRSCLDDVRTCFTGGGFTIRPDGGFLERFLNAGAATAPRQSPVGLPTPLHQGPRFVPAPRAVDHLSGPQTLVRTDAIVLPQVDQQPS
jgi:hypothetical protein